jgi:membrane dipeptidase
MAWNAVVNRGVEMSSENHASRHAAVPPPDGPHRRAMLGALGAALAAGPALAQDATLDHRAQDLHRRLIVVDPHADVPDDFGVGRHEAAVDSDSQDDLPKLRVGGVEGVAWAVFAPTGPRTADGVAAARALCEAKLAAILATPIHHPDQAVLASKPADIVAAKATGKVAIIPSFLNAYALGDDLGALDSFHARGVRLFGLTHAGQTAFADSSRPKPGDVPFGGLSPLGRQAVARLNTLGALIDVSQLTREGVLQTLALSRAPVVASHSGVRGMVDTPRNLSDAELDAIAANGGVVHIVAFRAYLVREPADYPARAAALRSQFSLPLAFKAPTDGAETLSAVQRGAFINALHDLLPPATVASLVDSVDYAVKRIGVDHVGVSSDFNHGGGVVGWANEAEAGNVTRELMARGYRDKDIAKLWGGNFLRAWSAAQAAA